MLLDRLTRFAGVAAALTLSFSATARADSFDQINLVANTPGIAAHTDPNLINPWGMSFSATSPFWASDQGAGVATLYDGAGNITSLVVTVPGSVGGPTGPTGTIFNAGTGFQINGSPARFIFANLNGTISGWNGVGTTAIVEAATPGAIYTGLAIDSANTQLYAANSSQGRIDVFNSSFAPVSLGASAFTDPNAIAGFVPFNVQLVGSSLYVTYARLGPGGAPLPGGYVDIFNTNGTFVSRFATGGPLAAPWGVTMAPAGFGSLGNDILVGNFGNGEINAFTPTGGFVETLVDTHGNPIVNDFLWALDFRTGGTNINPNALYITAGINNERGGLFAEIVPTPEPTPLLLVGIGLAGLSIFARRRGMLSNPHRG